MNFYFKFWFSCLSLSVLQFSFHMKIVFHLETQRIRIEVLLSVIGAAFWKFWVSEHLKSSFSDPDVINKNWKISKHPILIPCVSQTLPFLPWGPWDACCWLEWPKTLESSSTNDTNSVLFGALLILIDMMSQDCSQTSNIRSQAAMTSWSFLWDGFEPHNVSSWEGWIPLQSMWII